MVTPIETFSAFGVRAVPAHRVYLREFWAQEWTLQPYLRCDGLAFNVAPDLPEAQLSWEYGRICQPGATSYATYERLAIRFRYVKVEIDQTAVPESEEPATPIVWYGIVVDEQDHSDGAYLAAGETPLDPQVRVAVGRQLFRCFGLEFLLMRRFVTQSIVRGPSGEETVIQRAITFNEGKGERNDHDITLRGNLDPEAEDFIALLSFAADLGTAATWKARNIVDYLLYRFPPHDLYGDAPIDFDLQTTTLLDWSSPAMPAHGRNLYDLLTELIDRRRGLAWWLAPDPDDAQKLQICVGTFAAEAVDLIVDGEPLLLPANANLRSLDLDLYPRASATVQTTSESTRYDQVVAYGARRTSTCSVSPADETWVRDWTDEHQTGYDAGGTGLPGYDDLDDAKKKALDDQIRSQHGLERVYRWFKLPDDWNGMVNDGENGADDHAANPELPTDGSPLIDQPAATLWLPGVRLLPWLAIKTDHDYTGTLVTHDDAEQDAPEKSQPEQLRPMAFIKVPSHVSGEASTYALLERPHEVSPLARLSGGPDWHASIRPQQNSPGLVIDIVGAPQHVIAASEFVGESDLDDETAELDWLDNLIVTICFEADEHARGKYPADEADVLFETIADTLRVLSIDAGENYRLDYLAPGTALGTEDGALIRTTSGGFLRDDRELLDAIARMAYEWHRRPREAFDLSIDDVNGQFRLGHLITQLGGAETLREVNALITEVRYDLLRGTTRVRTGYAELDLARLARG